MSSDSLFPLDENQAFQTLYAQIENYRADLKIQSSEACLLGQFAKVKNLSQQHADWLTYKKSLRNSNLNGRN